MLILSTGHCSMGSIGRIAGCVKPAESAVSTDWDVAGLKGALDQWVGGILACAFSLRPCSGQAFHV